MIFKKKNCDIIFFPYRPPLRADNISKQRGGLDCVQGYPNREMNRKADRSALQLTEDASWDEFIFTPVYDANGQRQSAELLKNTRKTTERFKRRAWVGDERFMITHSISVTAGLWLVSGIPAAPKRSQSRPNGWRISNSPHISHTDWKRARMLLRYYCLYIYIYNENVCFGNWKSLEVAFLYAKK